MNLTSPTGGANFTAPANIAVTATAADSDGSIAKVEFYRGSTLITTLTTAPYSFTWTGVEPGSYALTAVATDDLGARVASAAVSIAVNAGAAQVYYIQTDHLNTPRLIADSSGTTVWRWDQGEPFGNDVPNNDPSGLGVFEFPLRFPGQYFDPEIGSFYNYFRNYDQSLGRYREFDLIGLRGGVNGYAYVGAQPLNRVDPLGLKALTDSLIGDIIKEISPGGPIGKIAEQCGKTLCGMGAGAGVGGSDLRQRWTLKLCEPAIAFIPGSRSSADPVLKCMEICDKIVNRCRQIPNAFCPPPNSDLDS